MGFATGLSGLKAASTDLQATGNNIANANTVGFKKSRTEFGDIFASSLGGVARTQPGSGVRVTEVAQQFSQGSIDATENSLDLAISGNGFFTLADDINAPQPTAFTRNGAFQLDKDGNVINDRGQFLMAFAPNGKTAADGFSQGVFGPLTIDTSQGLPEATQNVNTQLNLDSSRALPATAPFDPTDATSYNNTTSVTIFDSQGNAHVASTFFVKTAAPNEWDLFTFIDGFGVTAGTAASAGPPPVAAVASVINDGGTTPGTPNLPGAPVTMSFTSSGLLDFVGAAGSTAVDFVDIDLSVIDPNINVDPLSFDNDYLGSTQFSTPFSVNNLNQDGLPAGNLTGIDVSDEGVVFARFSNGGSKPLGQVALARFPSDQGLAKLGDTIWAESATSGQPIFGAAGSNNFGSVQSAALESSNVDLSAQLVRLIIAQQAFQANSQTISTENTITQTILNI
ncbi:MAG: flagellar hook protein FlgE [Gammaproteobacteria bacterium HGW-Gammaproteobacteria-3]|nr:MAG: flagellar hook protein FlgE [Gammaproteobacteria bacterium HGW-Gammaproteobacteria-3]